uniref:AMMECR1 domain-containing protein n=1 Tax=Panagrolaimus sp. ES5 TaxID=591445 RepID=A0AC34F8E1_9BILA
MEALDKKDKLLADKVMAIYCFDIIISHLRHKTPPPCPDTIVNEKVPLFITWKKASNHHLRGCIGTFSRDLPLRSGLVDYAKTSAFNDSRFAPITLNEVPSLQCGVSLLIDFEKARNYLDWDVGIHGIRIEFYYNGRRLSAVYLPEVAVEQGWNQIDTVDHLMRKGGYEGAIYEEDRLAIAVEKFKSSKVIVTYKVR